MMKVKIMTMTMSDLRLTWSAKLFLVDAKSTSAAFFDQGGVENVMAANLLITVEFWCDGIFMRRKRA